ncbi:MAG TPA: RHS repeat-associated core domain-containing protein [Chthoniobacterales bacterium]|nr:RHS repeat-associated core domain-containing protein [Chthoniobacterales bacterium]
MRIRLLFIAILALSSLAGSAGLQAQNVPLPADNPTGNTGALKAQIETAGSHDAHSGNGSRIVNDLRVPDALGVYGLEFTRYWNSGHNDADDAHAEWPQDFGMSGWSHSWHWHAAYVESSEGADQEEEIFYTSIIITFPDNHTTKYQITRSNRPHGYPPNVIPPDPRCGQPYSPGEINGGWPHGGVGVHDHICHMAVNGSEFWLCRADGGSVHFVLTTFGYQATEVFDPHGFRTDLIYNQTTGNLERVEQEGGRSLLLTWGLYRGDGTVITSVDSGRGTIPDGKSVTYRYGRLNDTYLVLGVVGYPDDQSPGHGCSAVYHYGLDFNPTSTIPSDYPLLKRADDPHYTGPMTTIRYNYRGWACPPQVHHWGEAYNPNYAPAQQYGVSEELSDAGHLVSSLIIECPTGLREESNGIGGRRKFYFGTVANTSEPGGWYGCKGYQLGALTDFTNASAIPGGPPCPPGMSCHRQNYYFGDPYHIWDGRNNQTQETVYDGDDSGEAGEIKYADNSTSTYDRINVIGDPAFHPTRMFNYYNHWLYTKTDENGNVTRYTRDARRRINRIDYQDESYETFQYDNGNPDGLNQITSHRLPSGAIETYRYDANHRLSQQFNDVDGENALIEYTYDEVGRVKTVRDGRARANSKDFSTRMTYNGRHQILSVEYAGMLNASDNPKVQYAYDRYGNCITIIDELGHRKEFTYDSYRRCTKMVESLNAPSWNGSETIADRTWEWIYDRYIDRVDGYGNPVLDAFFPDNHTSKEWRVQIEPAFNAFGHRRLSAQKFNCNNQIIEAASGLYQDSDGWHGGPDTEVHHYTYDANGQKDSYTDPRGRLTRYTYDERNRLKETIEPKRRDQTANPITKTEYDHAGNKTIVTFPDQRTQQWSYYNAFGQPRLFTDERGKSTNLEYWPWGPMKKLAVVTTHRTPVNNPTENQVTRFYYDYMGRPQSTYFPDNSYEAFDYEFGQLHTFVTRKGQVKHIHYDPRGREDFHTWDDGAAPGITRIWDPANRLTSISNAFSGIVFGYDDASQVKSEQDNVTGANGPAQINYLRYPSGEVAHLQYPNGTMIRHDYTARGQLELVQDSSTQQPVHYYYWPDGKVDHQDYANGTTSVFGYDPRGFITSVRHMRSASNQTLSYRDYWRDDRDRITAWKKGSDQTLNPMENGRGDRYDYDEAGELKTASYQAANPQGAATTPERLDMFVYDELGNRLGDQNHVASRGWMNFTHKDNGLNQYSGWWPYCFINYDDDIGGEWGAPHRANGVIMQDGWITGGFNALNQPMKILSHAYNGTGKWMWFGFNPLGRCVKRWVSPSAEDTSGATFFYYDGWNLIQEGPNATMADRLYIHGARVDEIVKSINYVTGQSAYHHYDARGHATLLTDSGGGILEQYDYDAFGFPYFFDRQGQPLTFYDTPSGSTRGRSPYGNRFLFTGREWLTDLKLYDYRNRLYQPELGRFLQPDPKQFEAGDYNLYRYCYNDPINKSDAFGLFESPVWLQALVPGQTEWDAAVTSYENGNYGMAGLHTLTMLAEQYLYVNTLGTSRVLLSTGRAVTANVSRHALAASIANKGPLKQLFGVGVKGAEQSLARLQAGGALPQGLTREMLITYQKIAQQTIAAGKDAAGTQAARLKVIKEALRNFD